MRPALLAGFLSAFAIAGGGGTVMVKSKHFLAEVAATEREKERGLMYRQSLAKDRCQATRKLTHPTTRILTPLVCEPVGCLERRP